MENRQALGVIKNLIGLWQHRLKLTNWRITVSSDEGLWDDGKGMATETDCKYRRAHITFDPKILEFTEDAPEDTPESIKHRHGSLEFNVIHELMHVVLAEFAVEAKFAADLVKAVNESRGDDIYNNLKWHEERLADLLATVIEEGWEQ